MSSDQQRPMTDLGQPSYGESWPYTPLDEPQLSQRLAQLATPQSIGSTTHAASIQPCLVPKEKSQDRYVINDIVLDDGLWRLRAIFDGHAGEETAEYVSQLLPTAIESALASHPNIASTPQAVSDLLVKTIKDIDDAIVNDLFAILPPQQDLAQLTNDQVKGLINDADRGAVNITKVLRCMRGSTALVSLIDPSQSHLWVASLGDCQAALGSKPADSEDWDVTLLSSNHNGTDESEVKRIRKEHPGEEECVLKHRVLGAIAVTRALGDHEFKLPRLYTDRVFLNAVPGFKTHHAIEGFMHRNQTPPYLSNIADVQHIALQSREYILVMCSDGLMDLYEGQFGSDHAAYDLKGLAEQWLRSIRQGVQSGAENIALYLLRQAMGGGDDVRLAQMLTVEVGERWMDDTTIIVEHINP